MQQVILQPTGNRGARANYQNTIKREVPMEKIAQFLEEDTIEELQRLMNYSNGVPTWGVTPGKSGVNINKWNKVQRGDVTLFAAEKRVYSAGTVVLKVHAPDLARALWGENSDGNTWEYVYFLDEITSLQIPYLDLNRTIGYSDNNVIQGFTVLDSEKSERVLEAYDLTSEVHFPMPNAEAGGSTRNFVNEELDRRVEANQRREQAYLRNKLFGGSRIGGCHFCQNELPIEFLVAAHIKKRSKCTQEEKLDEDNVVIPLCRFGCDELFERGHVVVNNKIIEANPTRLETSTDYLNKMVSDIVGTHVDVNSGQNHYFEWHYNYHKNT
ncbi:HNH endonuclease [Salimicrobium jeotgali]|uniref:HNH endonuclease n=1 Tax=Salimicrobium jeotgali TaxID=1230341 RepID=UPI000C8638C8|nr:HNH endonuclease [Salimicrobium jeotgali]